jgi:hypothetical protein
VQGKTEAVAVVISKTHIFRSGRGQNESYLLTFTAVFTFFVKQPSHADKPC